MTNLIEELVLGERDGEAGRRRSSKGLVVGVEGGPARGGVLAPHRAPAGQVVAQRRQRVRPTALTTWN